MSLEQSPQYNLSEEDIAINEESAAINEVTHDNIADPDLRVEKSVEELGAEKITEPSLISSNWTEMTVEDEKVYEQESERKRNFLLKFTTDLQQNYLELKQKNTDERSPINAWSECLGYRSNFHTPTIIEFISRIPNLTLEDMENIANHAKESGSDEFDTMKKFIENMISLQPAKGLKTCEIGGSTIALSTKKLGAEAFYYGSGKDTWDDIGGRSWYGTSEKLTL